MITLDLRTQHFTLKEVFQAAASQAVHVITEDGTMFVLEQADTFEREVAQLGQSAPFMALLAERARETGGISLDDAIKRLERTEAAPEDSI